MTSVSSHSITARQLSKASLWKSFPSPPPKPQSLYTLLSCLDGEESSAPHCHPGTLADGVDRRSFRAAHQLLAAELRRDSPPSHAQPRMVTVQEKSLLSLCILGHCTIRRCATPPVYLPQSQLSHSRKDLDQSQTASLKLTRSRQPAKCHCPQSRIKV